MQLKFINWEQCYDAENVEISRENEKYRPKNGEFSVFRTIFLRKKFFCQKTAVFSS